MERAVTSGGKILSDGAQGHRGCEWTTEAGRWVPGADCTNSPSSRVLGNFCNQVTIKSNPGPHDVRITPFFL